MAEVAQIPTADRIIGYLDYLLSGWGWIPQLTQEWATWDEWTRLEFVSEWAIREDRLGQLRAWAERGLLTPEQQSRLDEVEGLVAQHRSTIDQLFRGLGPVSQA